MVSFRGLEPPAWVLAGIESGRIAAVCLFAYNVESPAQLRRLTDALHLAARRAGRYPPLVGIDQEGGQLMAVTGGATELPGNMALGATRSPELARQAGAVLGRELLALGCNLDFAPVLDLADHLESAVVGTRAFSDDPQLAAVLGAATIDGLQSSGVLATAKHFPGHGDTALDSHDLAPVVSRSRAQLDLAELLPFREAIAAGVEAVMSAHVRYSALDDVPATLSPAILGTLLRDELGFGGLAITDAMDMKAVADAPAPERALQAIRAGADLVLLGHLPDQERLIDELEPHFRRASLARIDEARAALRSGFPDPGILGCREHLDLAQEIADRAVTVVRGGEQLPLSLSREEELGLLLVLAGDLSPADSSASVEQALGRQLRTRHPRVTEVMVPADSSREQLDQALRKVRDCRLVVVGTVNAVADRRQAQILTRLEAGEARVVHLALRSPADAIISPGASICLCTYGIRAVNTEAAVRALFGEIEATGLLPVRLPERPVPLA